MGEGIARRDKWEMESKMGEVGRRSQGDKRERERCWWLKKYMEAQSGHHIISDKQLTRH